ncbi:MAG: hypothetical protein WBD20_20020 [Pirellulaceae bacterium]
MEDKLPRFEASTQPVQSLIRLHEPADESDDRCQSLDTELKKLLADFRSLQLELDGKFNRATPLSQFDPNQECCDVRDASETHEHKPQAMENPTSDTLAEISQIQSDLSTLMDLRDENDNLREVIAGATETHASNRKPTIKESAAVSNRLKNRTVRLRIFDPDNELDEPQDSALSRTLSDLQREIEGGEDDLARAQRMLDRMLRSPADDQLTTEISDSDNPTFQIAACSKATVEGSTNTDSNSSELKSIELEHDESPEVASSEPDAVLVQRIDELVIQEEQLQLQLADAIAQREDVRTQFDQLQLDSANQKERHAAELLASESAAQQKISAEVAAERLSLSKSQTESLAEQLTRLQDAQAEQNVQLENRTRELQQRLETAICSEAELRVKLDVAKEALKNERQHAQKAESQYADRISSLTEQLNQAEAAADRLAAEQQELESMKALLESERDQSVQENESLRTTLTENQSRLKTLQQEAQRERNAAAEQLAAEQQRLESLKAALEGQRDQSAEENETLRATLTEKQIRLDALQQEAQRERDAAAEQLAAEQQRLESLKAALEGQRDQSTEETEALRASLAENQLRLDALQQEAARDRETATQEALSLKENLSADQERLNAIRQELESQRDEALADNAILRSQIETLNQERVSIQLKIGEQAHQLQLSSTGEAEMRQTLQQERDAVAKAVGELTHLQRGHEQLQAQCAQQVAQIQSLLEQKDQLASEQDSKSKSLNAQTAELLRISATHQNLVRQSEAQANQIAALLRENESHCSDRERTAEVISQKDSQLAELLGLQSQLADQLTVLTNQVRTLLNRYEATKARENDARQRLAQQLNEIAELEQRFQAERLLSDSHAKQLDDLRRERDLLNLQLAENDEAMSLKQSELDQLMADYAQEQRNCHEQTEALQVLKDENDRLQADEATTTETLCETLRERMQEIERLRELHESIRAQSVEQADKIMRLINENQRLTRADRLRSQELTERKSELVHLRDAMEDLKLNSDVQASRIDLLINEKRQLIKEKKEAEALGFANLQAAANDFQQLKNDKQAVDQQLAKLQTSETSAANSSAQPNRVVGLTSKPSETSGRRSKPHVDDLTKIEGIGPKIQSLLAEKRIVSFRKLAATKVDRLQKILLDAGGSYHMHDPSTWPDQAQLAAEGNWKRLVRLQDSLIGGRKVG